MIRPRGRRPLLELPEEFAWPQLREARTAYRELLTQAQATAAQLDETSAKLEQAKADDVARYAAALKAGKSDPGDKEIERVGKEIAAGRRKLEALELALDEAEGELTALLEQHRTEWIEEMEREAEQAREAYAAAVEALVAARGALQTPRGVLAFLHTFPDVKGVKASMPPLRALTATHGGPTDWPQVEQALREDAAPPKPKAVPAQPAQLQPVRRRPDVYAPPATAA